ncbi:hypothetical protein GR160_02910 [Flavobacterium sp. Sd200]|uniref:hypothetical protein n=1 Tax=Flavobacterium sp. Sd200 TaxID=2692211 RepID=UPI00136FBA63|nr:hypothetical protein [Flavobacterium sp. Sd200]MXN90164.1 hypothetical protein [Flavobacterium sp. Sd200]
MSDINQLLYRPLKDGKKYNRLIPESACERVDLGTGMTDYTVKKMAEWIYQYAWHMAKVAPLMQQQLLEDTCEEIHMFAYHHFTYRADLAEQFLRSPACAWHSRHEGLDCKSYSIICSALLLNLGITHYIRRIRQDSYEPDLWTHVYVIVPVDQQTGSLNKGYYFVDGTVPFDTEPEFLEKDDYMMQHTGLAGARPQGLNSFDWNSIKGLFAGGWSFNCIGGTYDANDFNNASGPAIVKWMADTMAEVNAAMRANSSGAMSVCNKLLVQTQQIKDHAANTASKDWSSNCSKQATNAYRALGEYYNNIVTQAFLAWLEKYFTVTYTTERIMNNTFDAIIRTGKGFKKEEFERFIDAKKIASMVLKPGQQNIVEFELTAYNTNTASYANNSFDAIKALAEMAKPLVTIGAAVIGGSNNNSGGSGSVVTDPYVNNGNYAKGDNSGGTTSTAQMVGGAILIGGLAYFLLMPDTPKKGLNASKSKKSSTKTKV